MLNKIIMTLECLVSNPLRKQMLHQDYFDLRSRMDCTDESREDETCLQFKMKEYFIETRKIAPNNILVVGWLFRKCIIPVMVTKKIPVLTTFVFISF